MLVGGWVVVATNFSVSSRLSLPDPCLSFTKLSMRTDSQDKRDKNYPARIPFVFKGDSIQIQIVMVRPCESHLVIFNLIYLIKPMPSFFDNPDPFLFVKLREREGQRVDLGRSLKGRL